MKEASQGSVDHLFRQESGKMIAVLSKQFGIHYIDTIEDAVQDAFVKAFQSWKINGQPPNPIGWLYLAAKNKTIDLLRRERRKSEIFQEKLIPNSATEAAQDYYSEYEIEDSQLRMMFAICHPTLKSDDQIALVLKIISGFSMKEIANALLINLDSVKQRVSRAKRKIKSEKIDLHIPTGSVLQDRIENVMTVLYLMFNEGYYSTTQAIPIRKDLCMEAMRLTKILSEHKISTDQNVYALLALMCYHASRFESRPNQANHWITLESQDRSLWNKELIQVANYYMKKAAQDHPFHIYQIEAAIAAIHCHSTSLESTDWERLLILYEALLVKKPFPVIELNIAIVHIQMDGLDEAGLILKKLEGALNNYPLYHMVKAELAVKQNDLNEANNLLLEALSLAKNEHEKQVITAKMTSLNTG